MSGIPDLIAAGKPNIEYVDWTGKAIIAMEKEQRRMLAKPKSSMKIKEGILGTTVRDQDNENICWAIAVASATEAINNLKRPGEVVWVGSSQELINHVEYITDSSIYEEGKGKLIKHVNLALKRMSTAWDHVRESKLSREEHYKYVGRREFTESVLMEYLLEKQGRGDDDLLRISGFVEIGDVKEDELLRRLYDQPVIGIFDSNKAFATWDGLGIFNGEGSVERERDLNILKIGAEVEVKFKGKGGKAKEEKLLIQANREKELQMKDVITVKDIEPYLGKINIDPRTAVSHAALISGYGTSPEGTHYYFIRNSYGTQWGVEGIGKIMRASSLGVDSSGGPKASLVKAYSYPCLDVEEDEE